MWPDHAGAILHFQTQVRNRGLSVRPDGIVNRARGVSRVSSISSTVFTIVFLYRGLKDVIGEGRRRLEDDPITPFLLQVKLAASALR